MKKKTPAKLKAELDRVFSIFIRQKYADSNGFVKCYTCTTRKHWKELHCGHFEKRHHLATRWLEENCRPQCPGCNLFRDGNYPEYAYQLEKEKKGTINFLHRERDKIFKVSRDWYEEKIAFYNAKIT